MNITQLISPPPPPLTLSFASLFAPAPRSVITTTALPSLAARCMGVCPFCGRRIPISAPPPLRVCFKRISKPKGPRTITTNLTSISRRINRQAGLMRSKSRPAYQNRGHLCSNAGWVTTLQKFQRLIPLLIQTLKTSHVNRVLQRSRVGGRQVIENVEFWAIVSGGDPPPRN